MRGDGPYLDLSTEQIRFRLRKTSNPNPSVNFYRRNTSLPPPPSQIFVSRFIARKLGCYVIEAKKTSPSRRADRSRIASTNLIEIRVNLVPSKNGRPFYACEQITTADDTRAEWHEQHRWTKSRNSGKVQPKSVSTWKKYVYAWFAINIPRENWDRDIYTLI